MFGPCEDLENINFLDELSSIRIRWRWPWIIGGHFIMVCVFPKGQEDLLKKSA